MTTMHLMLRAFSLKAVTLCAAFTVLSQSISAQECTISAETPVQVGAAHNPIHAPLRPDWSAHFAGHGQLIFGTGKVYLHHLAVPMISADSHPHSFQVLLEVTFADAAAHAAYVAEVASNPDSIFTAIPDRFDQTALIASYPGFDPLRTLPNTEVFRGHFEQGGARILSDETKVERVVHAREFSLGAEPISHLTYILFGDEHEVFMVHFIDGSVPNFDSILEVAIDGVVTDVLAQNPLFVEVPSRANSEAERLRANETIQCAFEARDGSATDLHLQVAREIYCEAGEFSDFVVGNNFNNPRRCTG